MSQAARAWVSSEMKTHKLETRWMFRIAGVLLVAAGVTASLPAQALPRNEAERFYFSTAAKTQQVGSQIILMCGGGKGELYGSKTAYYTTRYTPCI